VRLIETLADASGTSGMAGGQALDLAAEGRSLTLAEIEQIHVLKTGALIRASVVMAAHCAPSLAPARLQSLADFGSTVGIAFQIQDDLLDVEGDVALIGKATGSDEARAMPTYPAIAGLESARARVRELHRRAAESLATHGWGNGPLADLADWLLTRRH
jgi:geranylgeranyl pyrophosphate synthase